MTIAILSIAAVLIPYNHALRIFGMQQRLRRRIKHAVHHPLAPIDCIFLARYMQRELKHITVYW